MRLGRMRRQGHRGVDGELFYVSVRDPVIRQRYARLTCRPFRAGQDIGRTDHLRVGIDDHRDVSEQVVHALVSRSQSECVDLT